LFMKTIVNGLEIGWDGITVSELMAQAHLAAMPAIPLGRAVDLRLEAPYGRLTPLYPVAPEKSFASRSVRWLCRCSCEKQRLVVVMAQSLRSKTRPCTSCGCWHQVRALENLAALKHDPYFQQRQAEAASEAIRRYHREHSELVTQQSRKNAVKLNTDPVLMGLRQQRVRRVRSARNLDPDVPISTRYVLIRHAILLLTKHILRVRDDYTCTLCQRRGKVRLAVHHVIPAEADPTRVGDPCNLVTLCFLCHFHRAHAGNWRTVDPQVQAHLLAIAVDREIACPTDPDLVQIVRSRLDIIHQKQGLA